MAKAAIAPPHPYGLDEMFEGVLRANKPYAQRDLFEAKAASYLACWPWVRTVGWDDTL